jgi:TPR repeat protein
MNGFFQGAPAATDDGWDGDGWDGMETERGAAGAAGIGATPEDILRAVFQQALTGGPAALPHGATVTALRQALVLDPAVSARLFNEAKARAAEAASPAAVPVTLQAAPLPATLARKQAGKTRLIAALVVAFGLAATTLAAWLSRPPPTISALFVAAATSPAAYQKLLACAKSGDAPAQFALAALADRRFAQHETVVAKNDALAFEWYQQAAQAGYAPAVQALGYAYLNGHGVARNPALAAEWTGKAAQAGLPVAENSLGMMYQAGIGVMQDHLHAAAWFAKAAAQGLPAAENNLGAAYESGNGVTQNDAQAAAWYARAAQQGEPNAENNLGYLFFTGQGVARDTNKSARLFAAAALAGVPAAEVNLGLSLASGAGLAKNPELGAVWCFRGQAAGAKDATAALALITPQLTPAQIAAALAAAKRK